MITKDSHNYKYDDIERSNLRRRIIEYRARHNLTQTEMAKLCGVSRTTIYKAERLRAISAVTEIRILSVCQDRL